MLNCVRLFIGEIMASMQQLTDRISINAHYEASEAQGIYDAINYIADMSSDARIFLLMALLSYEEVEPDNIKIRIDDDGNMLVKLQCAEIVDSMEIQVDLHDKIQRHN